MQAKSLRYGNVKLKEDWVIEDTSVKDACILTAAILDEILRLVIEHRQMLKSIKLDIQAGKIANVEEHDLYQESEKLMGQIRDLETYSNTWNIVSDSQQG